MRQDIKERELKTYTEARVRILRRWSAWTIPTDMAHNRAFIAISYACRHLEKRADGRWRVAMGLNILQADSNLLA